MKSILLLSVLVLVCISCSMAKDLLVGTTYGARLTWQEKANYMGIPFKKRTKFVFFSDPGQQIIKGLIARESSQTDGEATITAGGVGYSFVNIRLKSERGCGLDYSIEIYV